MKIGELVEVQSGLANARRYESEDGSHLLVRPGDIPEDGSVQVGKLHRVSPDRDVTRYLVRGGDILFVPIGPRYRARVYDGAYDRVIASDLMWRLRMREGVSLPPAVLAERLNQPEFLVALKSIERGKVMRRVTQKGFLGLEMEISAKAVHAWK